MGFLLLAVVLIAGLSLSASVLWVGDGARNAAGASTAPSSAAVPGTTVAAVSPDAGATHGDLNVTNDETFYIPGVAPPAVPSTYYQGGNITVQSGGTLIVHNVTLSFVQFVGDTGTPLTRLSHVFHLTVKPGGKVFFGNATLTSDLFSVNPYPKLDIVDDGSLTFYRSNIETGGFLNVGTDGVLTLNSSRMGSNPSISDLVLPSSIVGDAGFAPTLNVSGGGTANLFSSVLTDVYGDDLQTNGSPNPFPLDTPEEMPISGGVSTDVFTTPTDPASLTQDYLYPSGIGGGEVTFLYDDTNNASTGNTSLSLTLTYDGHGFLLGTYLFVSGTAGEISYPFPSTLDKLVNDTGGMMGWLNRSGDFDLASQISVGFTGSGPSVEMPVLSIQPFAPLDFGENVNGTGSVLNAVNTYIGLDFPPFGTLAWLDHELNVTNGSTAYLANLTVAGELQNGTSQAGYGAIVPDDASHAYLFRWADVITYGKNGIERVPGSTVTADYAYPTPQLDNQTANNLVHNLSTYDPAIWGYVQYWDSYEGDPAYGESGPSGVASILVASNNIYGQSTPDGDYLGDYHVIVSPPAGYGTAQAFTGLVSAYPLGVAFDSAGYGLPDVWGSLTFPLFYADAAFSAHNGIVVTADNVTTTTFRIGALLVVDVNVSDSGAATIQSLSGSLNYGSPEGPTLATVPTESTHLTAPGQNATLTFTWRVNDTIVGLQQAVVTTNLSLTVTWNQDLANESGGFLQALEEVHIQPSNVRVADVSIPPTKLTATVRYLTTGEVIYNGSYAYNLQLVATSGSSTVVLAGGSFAPAAKEGHPAGFSLSWTPSLLTQGKGYTLTVVASYNGVVTNYTIGTPGSFVVPAPPVSSLFTHKYLGLPLWLWITIAAAIVVAAVGFLLLTRRQAAGKLVECGECGNLVPEDAKTCPKCGAEFESDVVRCSRCSSTIPASSKFCPECAAQLLGKPGEGAEDPERQAYADFTERFRAEAKKELGENYGEGAFWDWWKRQPSYTPFSQWKIQQGQGTARTGMTAPPPSGCSSPRRSRAVPRCHSSRRTSRATGRLRATRPSSPPRRGTSRTPGSR